MNHEKDCVCCQHGVEAVLELEQKGIEEYGWYAHVVPNDNENSPTGLNLHTHNLPKAFNHLDLQVVVPIDPKVSMTILHTLVNDFIKKGITLEPKKEYAKVIGHGYKVTFAKAKECGRDVLRLILPDNHGYIQENEPMNAPYDKQYEGTLK